MHGLHLYYTNDDELCQLMVQHIFLVQLETVVLSKTKVALLRRLTILSMTAAWEVPFVMQKIWLMQPVGKAACDKSLEFGWKLHLCLLAMLFHFMYSIAELCIPGTDSRAYGPYWLDTTVDEVGRLSSLA